MKVLHVTAYPPHRVGGLMIFVKNLVEYETKFGIHCEILTTNIEKPISYHQKEGQVRTHYMRNYGDLFGLNPLFNVISFIRKNHHRFDLIHVHSYIHFSSIQSIFIGKLLKIPVVLTLHGGVQTQYSVKSTIFDKFLLNFKELFFDKIIGRMCLKLPEALISVSKSDILAINKIFNLKRKKNNFWIPNAVKTEFYSPSIPIITERKYITYISPRLTHIKGFDLFLRIMDIVNESIPNIPILIVGKGDLVHILPEYRKRLNICYFPSVPHEKISNIYHQTKIFMLTSRFEGLPTTLLEAMICETPVISTDVGGIRDVINDGINGLLYKSEEVEKAASLVIGLLENVKLQREIVENAKKTIQQNFDWTTITKKNILVYKKILK